MSIVLTSVIVLGIIGLIAAALLYAASRKFRVYEDPKISEIEELLPSANCGGCGYSGCHAFAVACASASSMAGLRCTSLDAEGMDRIAAVTGLKAEVAVSRKAVIRCKASCDINDPVNRYDGVRSCAIEAAYYQGESDCVYGCLGGSDCVRACPFGAMSIAPGETLPNVDFDLCTGCSQCVAACPRQIITLLPLSEGQKIYGVACSNIDKGPVALKECKVSCIGCGKCLKACQHGAVAVNSFLASIDADSCVGCGDCAEACPRNSIIPLSLSAGMEFIPQSEKSC